MNVFDPAASNERLHRSHRSSKHSIEHSQTADSSVADGGRETFGRFLVPFELPEAEPVSPALTEWLGGSHVVVLGHYAVPSQTPPELLRRQAGEDAKAELAKCCEPLERHDATVETQLVFGRERTEAIDRAARETSCGVEVAPAPVEEINRVLVPLRNMDQVHLFAGTLEQTEAQVTLFHVAEGDTSRGAVETKLEKAQRQLNKACETTVTTAVGTGRHRKAIVEATELHDLVVMGETGADLATRVSGPLPDRIVEQAGTPVFVVRSD